MSAILKDLSATALSAAIKGNLIEWWRHLGSSPKAEFYDTPELMWLLTGLPTPSVNVVLLKQVKTGEVDMVIKERLAHFRSRGVSHVSWWLGAGMQPTDADVHLVEHGLAHREGAPGMAVDLLGLNEDLRTPTGLTIEPVGDTAALRKWAHAGVTGFGQPETAMHAWIELFNGLGFDLPLRNYLGLLDGKPVATSQLLLGAGVAGIYVVATIPDARRQGIGTAMTLAPLRDARARGFRIGVLGASPLGLGVYRRMGFREYTRMSHYQ